MLKIFILVPKNEKVKELGKSAYLLQLESYDQRLGSGPLGLLKQLLDEFASQPPLEWHPNATIVDEEGQTTGVWVLMKSGSYCIDRTFRGPMILVDDRGGLYRTGRRLKFKNGYSLQRRERSPLLGPTDLTRNEGEEAIRMLKELVAHERNRQEYQALTQKT